jgi:hypothetical protein
MLGRTVPRENDQFGRHINLQLTYSFQQNTAPHSLQSLGGNNSLNNNTSITNNNNIATKMSLYHGKNRAVTSCAFDGVTRLMDISSMPAETSDELSEDSTIHCINEV